MLKLSLKRCIFVLILTAVFLAILAIALFKIEAAHNVPLPLHHPSPLAWFCPPPPLPC